MEAVASYEIIQIISDNCRSAPVFRVTDAAPSGSTRCRTLKIECILLVQQHCASSLRLHKCY